MFRLRSLTQMLLAAVALSGCLKEKDVRIDLPTDPSQLVVEAYLEPDSIYRVSLSETLPYFTLPQSLPIIADAVVTITYMGHTDTLAFYPIGSAGNFYPLGEYRLNKIIPHDHQNKFYLRAEDTKGRVVTGETVILPPVKIDTVFATFVKAVDASLQIEFNDLNPGVEDFHRIIFDTGKPGWQHHSFFSDRISNGTRLIWLTGATIFPYHAQDTVWARLYHCTGEYYHFFTTMNRAVDANRSPFAEPSRIVSNVTGGYGIFTGFSQDRYFYVVPNP